MRTALAILFAGLAVNAQALPGTAPLEAKGDLAEQMVNGILRYLQRATAGSLAARRPSPARLRYILGLNDARISNAVPELVGTLHQPALLAEIRSFRVYAVRWPVTAGMTAEGLLFQPTGNVRARVIAIPDADQLPEQLDASVKLAAAGCEVLSPVLINRKDTWSGNPAFRMTNQPHREYLYRMSFEVGRTLIGYEVEKVLAAVDYFSGEEAKPIGVYGYGEGGAIAMFAAALEPRIQAAAISGYFGPREKMATQPLYRNVFGLLRDFGDAELLAMTRGAVVVDRKPGPAWDGPSMSDPNRRGAAPMKLQPYSTAEVDSEFRRAQALRPAGLSLEHDALDKFLRALSVTPADTPRVQIPVRDAEARQHRQFDELCNFAQAVVRKSWFVRQALWAKTEHLSQDQWSKISSEYRSKLWDGPIGRLPKSSVPMNVRTRHAYEDTRWNGYDVVYDVAPEVIGYGVLLVPRDIAPGERRPVVVAQHGLNGRPQNMFSNPEIDRLPDRQYTRDFHFYQNVGSRLADRGYVVYMPQNPYIGDFRPINAWANPLGLSMFSFILAQHDRMLDWVSSLPYVDPAKIGFYGLSYGGKTAVRVPALLERYALSICSGDYNEWITKVATTDWPFSYLFTNEWEMDEFDLGSVANHSEMAKMIAPRPFMVERGHRDGVGIDEWIAFEYAPVKRFYDEMGIGNRTEFEYFNGPHMMHLQGTMEFLRKYLGR